ncbi:hypothetical protein ABZT03_41855 [Streptomyces sp. NPDC005574]|uniref:hypothetical protein n=1 Tax=Streptomyces sp. NPDC005574 TaxID=3156891 RepID=UPI0033BF7CAD
MTTYTTVGPQGRSGADAAGAVAGSAVAGAAAEPLRLFAPRVRGRHRRPRPRKVLLAAGGLALAAGVLSLVRLAPDSGVAGIDSAEAEPSADPGTDAGRSTNAAASLRKAPEVSPSSTSAMGGLSPSPTPDAGLLPAAGAPASPFTAPATAAAAAGADAAGPTPEPDSTTIPDTANTPAPTPTPRSPTTTAPAGRPTHTPAAPAPTRATAPPAPGAPGLCVPIIGLCVDPLKTAHD